MTIEKLTEFRQLYEQFKYYAKDKQCYILDLKEARTALSATYRITDEEFTAFYSEYLTKD